MNSMAGGILLEVGMQWGSHVGILHKLFPGLLKQMPVGMKQDQ